MKFAKFIIPGGQIVSKQEVAVSDLDQALLQRAMEILSQLRADVPGTTYPVPNAPSYSVGLGTPQNITWEELATELTAPGSPTDAPMMTREEWDEEEQKARHAEFYIMHGKDNVPFAIFPFSAISDDPALLGTIAGLFAGSHFPLSEEQADSRFMEEQIAEHKTVAAQIWAERPALVSPLEKSYSFTAFTDCFAAAMLLTTDKEQFTFCPK